MLVSDPAWAAQRQTASGDVFHYDDPGCLLVALDDFDREQDIVYFRHHAEDLWLRSDEASFVEVGPSPMGYGLGAVSVSEAPDGLGLRAARDRAVAVDRERSEP